MVASTSRFTSSFDWFDPVTPAPPSSSASAWPLPDDDRMATRYPPCASLRAAAAPSDAAWQQRWERAVQAQGLPVFRMPSGAGHDAMKLHEVMPQAMLFMRGGNAGISHNPLEEITNDDADLCVRVFQNLLEQLAEEQA